ncbi:hypothetical protein B5F10_10370 [Anaerotruncus colihominis]|uniref:Uncharacterized protein n=1 Tax=Anaerotruncus colihominis TaxID=169435 RepID=A0A1Y4MZB7_9FIRM|nr:hypothetical protein [Anaerotruncus colihominis]OUP67374.1 hypothetical protein B5F11_18450 [Anaerotruncus colihominis]OUP73519.1 hypothetical protein B5F10_10370 [Anaerotruncus colihominis]
MKEYGMTDGKVIHLFFVDCSGETKFGKEPLQQYQTFRQIEQTGGGYVQLTGSGLYQQFYKHMISRPNAPYVDPNLTNFDLSPFSYRLDDVITREDITLGPVVAAVKYPWEASFFYFTDVSMYKTEEDLHAGKNEVNLKDFISEWTGNDQDLLKEVCMRCYGAYNFDITQLGDNYENKKVIFIYTEGLFN